MTNIDEISHDKFSTDHGLALGLQNWLRGSNVLWKTLIEAIFRPAGGGDQRLAHYVADNFKGKVYTSIHFIKRLLVCFLQYNTLLLFFAVFYFLQIYAFSGPLMKPLMSVPLKFVSLNVKNNLSLLLTDMLVNELLCSCLLYRNVI